MERACRGTARRASVVLALAALVAAGCFWGCGGAEKGTRAGATAKPGTVLVTYYYLPG